MSLPIKPKVARANRTHVKACGCCVGPKLSARRDVQDEIDELRGPAKRRRKRKKTRARGCSFHPDKKHRYARKLIVDGYRYTDSKTTRQEIRLSHSVGDICACGRIGNKWRWIHRYVKQSDGSWREQTPAEIEAKYSHLEVRRVGLARLEASP